MLAWCKLSALGNAHLLQLFLSKATLARSILALDIGNQRGTLFRFAFFVAAETLLLVAALVRFLFFKKCRAQLSYSWGARPSPRQRL